MNCRNAQEHLLDLLDEQADAALRTALEEHLGECPECAEVYQSLQKGHEALAHAIPRMAPERRHLTSARLQALERNIERDRKILTVRRFVGAAAAAAILVAVLFLYQDVRGWMEPTGPSTSDGQEVAGQGDVRPPEDMPPRVRLSSSDDGRGGGTVRGIVMRENGMSAAESSPVRSRAQILRTSTPGARVPVQNTLYDPEQDGYWW